MKKREVISAEMEKLIALGKQKGFLTYDEVNDLLPEDLSSSEEIDRLFEVLGNEDIQIIEAQEEREQEKQANIQREELNAIEEANAFERFISEFDFTQDRIAQVLGKDKSTVSNTLRLLSLPKKIQDQVSKDAISAGHAKALISLPTENEQIRVCNLIINKGLSVRETEKLVARRMSGVKKREVKANPGIDDLAGQLQHVLGTRVRIAHGKKRGTIQIEYYSTEDLNRILDIIIPKKA